MKKCCLIIAIAAIVLLFPPCYFSFLIAQETNTRISGHIILSENEKNSGVTITAVHQPTNNIFITQSLNDGSFYFENLKPGGPYTITVTHAGYIPVKKENLFFNLNNEQLTDIYLYKHELTLQPVTVQSSKNDTRSGSETNISQQQLRYLPSISRNLQDYVRLVPQAKVNGDGMMSLAGQNNKFNAFFIDGSNNNDMLGTATSGTNGGQTGSPPISMEALEEIKVLLSPYDVQYSNFTGGSINAITRSGTNRFKSSAWYFFRNENMAGRSPVAFERPGSPGISERPLLADLFNQTAGLWISGPVIKNKLFYFLLGEKQKETQPQSYDFSVYRGISPLQQFVALGDTLRKRYNYDPGSFLEASNQLNANRFILKLDWNPSSKYKLTLSYRYNYADRAALGATGSTLIRFSNNMGSMPSRTHSASLEWKAFLKNAMSNRLLVTYNNQRNDREINGQPFPVIRINDGPGAVILGSNGTSQINLFTSTEFSLLDVFRVSKNKHVFITGIDLNFSKLNDLIIQDHFGAYQFRSLNDFFSGMPPSRFTRVVSLTDEPKDDHSNAGSRFNTRRIGFFVNDDITISPRLRINAGLRIDGNSLPLTYKTDPFFNTVAKEQIEQYYDLEAALPGQPMKTHWQIAPRIGFVYKMPEENITFRGGAGIFTGRIINLWPSEIYNVNTSGIDINPQFYGIGFNPDPFNQPGLQTLGINPENNKGSIVIIARKFKYPTVFRTSLSADKRIKNGWTLTTEIMFTQNIHEGTYTNVNLLPPTKRTPEPGKRNVFSINTTPERIPMNGGNPYNNIILLSNKKSKKGASYSVTTAIEKTINDKLLINAGYAYSGSLAMFEATGNTSINSGQWSSMETVNGKNYAQRSVSDYDLGHRLFTSITKKITWHDKRYSTLVTIFYNGQSGTPFSYVYFGSIINDINNNNYYDLVYIPTKDELNTMAFLPTTAFGISYSPEQQKTLLNDFIENDKYLSKRRGEFAERNGARLPFTHVIDLRIQQDFIIKSKRREIQAGIIFDVFNFTNMINKDWGRTYGMSFDNYQLIQFAGFSNTTTLIPQFQFTPVNGKPWSVQSNAAPGSSARWISQLGFRINFN